MQFAAQYITAENIVENTHDIKDYVTEMSEDTDKSRSCISIKNQWHIKRPELRVISPVFLFTLTAVWFLRHVNTKSGNHINLQSFFEC